MGSESLLNDVSDTALWVAVYRADESERPDALFKDPLAGVLAGERGRKIANGMSASRYTRWSIITRTVMIDGYINELIQEGVDTVINLGAGLDTRPYRMKLPPAFHWIEVDYPQIIDLKNKVLGNIKPDCRLERISLDLSDVTKRRALFARLGLQSKKALVLTEGVTPYLSEAQVSSLAQDLTKQKTFKYWIADYFAPGMMKYLNTKRRKTEMKNAPFVFNPDDYFGFFESNGWKARETRYNGEFSLKIGRPIPAPWWAQLLMKIFGPPKNKNFLRVYGFTLFEPK